MRQNKEFSLIVSKKEEPQEMFYHCVQHPGCRMLRLADGLRCQICGGTEVATRTVFTFNNPSSLSTQELRQTKEVNN
jgi:hypothetical protein